MPGEKTKNEVMLGIEGGLQKEQLSMVVINMVTSVTKNEGCFGHNFIHVSSLEYIGMANVERIDSRHEDEGMLFQGAKIDSIKIFDKDRFVVLNDEERDSADCLSRVSGSWNWGKNDAFYISLHKLEKVKLIPFKNKKDLEYARHDRMFRHDSMGEKGDIVSIDIFTGDSSVLYDYLVSKDGSNGKSKILGSFTKLGLPIQGELQKDLAPKYTGEFMEFYGLYASSDGSRAKNDELAAMLSSLERKKVWEVVPSVKINNGAAEVSVRTALDEARKNIDSVKVVQKLRSAG